MFVHGVRYRPPGGGRTRSACSILLLCVGLQVQAAGNPAASEATPAGLTLDEALRLTELRHPLLQAGLARQAAAEARVAEARLRPALELSLEVEDVLGTGAWRGFSGAESTLEIARTIESAELRRARLDVALADRAGTAGEGAIDRLDIRVEVARRFIQVLVEQDRRALAGEAVRLAADTLGEVERRIELGRGVAAERSRAIIGLERARLDEEQAAAHLLTARRHLAAATGQDLPGFGPALGDLLELPQLLPLESLLDQLEASPEAMRYANEVRLRQSELRLAEARRRTPVSVGSGIRRSEAENDIGFVVSVAVPLFSGRRSAAALSQASAQLRATEATGSLALLRARAQLYELHQALQYTRLEFVTLREKIIPAAEAALEDTTRLFASGRHALFELRDAQREWAAQRARLIETAADYHLHLIDVQRLTGIPASVVLHPESMP